MSVMLLVRRYHLLLHHYASPLISLFFFTHPPTPAIYPLSPHLSPPIYSSQRSPPFSLPSPPTHTHPHSCLSLPATAQLMSRVTNLNSTFPASLHTHTHTHKHSKQHTHNDTETQTQKHTHTYPTTTPNGRTNIRTHTTSKHRTTSSA